MSSDEKKRESSIPGETVVHVDLIRETIMPPYEYQKPQNGFGSTSTEDPSFVEASTKKD